MRLLIGISLVLELVADCGRCFGLCCVAPAFAASADFAINKDAGRACPNMGSDSRCGIHAQLRERGFRGCTVYDCFGAGQHVAQGTFGGRDWRGEPQTSTLMFRAFEVMRQLHELLWYVTEALKLEAAREVHGELRSALVGVEALSNLRASELAALDVEPHRQGVNELLRLASALARRVVRSDPPDYAGADLIGSGLRKKDLRAANFRGACLVGADLKDADLQAADFTGADLRDADVRGANLGSALFVTQAQVEGAKGDAGTRLPPGRRPPAHWLCV
jgi:uncharacterized protein YjbI with pentapeptide repeats